MEAILIINSILVAICLYFIKDFHTEFKDVAKKVGKLADKVGRLTVKVNERVKTMRKTEKK